MKVSLSRDWHKDFDTNLVVRKSTGATNSVALDAGEQIIYVKFEDIPTLTAELARYKQPAPPRRQKRVR